MGRRGTLTNVITIHINFVFIKKGVFLANVDFKTKKLSQNILSKKSRESLKSFKHLFYFTLCRPIYAWECIFEGRLLLVFVYQSLPKIFLNKCVGDCKHI